MSRNLLIHNTLATALNAEYLTSELNKLAALICPKVPGRKIDRINIIVNILFKDLKKIFDQLSPLAQKAVAETVHNWDGFFEGTMFEAKYTGSPWSQPENKYKSDPLNLFIIHGQIPTDLLNELKKIVHKPPEDEINYTDAIVEEEFTVRNTSQAALNNLSTLLNLAADKKIRVSAKTKRATAATVKKITELLDEGDWYGDEEIGPMQAFAWPLLLQGGGLASTDGSFLKLRPAGRKALKSDLPNGIKTAWNKWEKNKIIDEFSRVTAIKGQKSSRGRTMTNPVKRRPIINMLIEELQPGKWVNVDELARFAQSHVIYSFDMVNYNWKLYLLDQHYGHLDYNDTWPLLQFRYILVYLFEYCATLGLIDVAYKKPQLARNDYTSCWGTDDLFFLCHCDGLQYVRINDLGAFVLGHTDEFTVKSDTTVSYSFEGKDIHFIGDDAIPPGQALYLEKIAQRQEIDKWRLSSSSLLTAIKEGENLTEIKASLAATSSNGLNKEIEDLFQDVEQRSTAFVDVGKTMLIKCSPELRKQALNHQKLSGLCMPAGEKHLAVLPGKEKQFTKALESIGFIVNQK